jgi:hypothetical protein
VERRSEPRFPVQQPAFIRFHRENANDLATLTENLSARGALLWCGFPVPLHSNVDVTLFLPGLWLKGTGRVIREQALEDGGFLVDAPFIYGCPVNYLRLTNLPALCLQEAQRETEHDSPTTRAKPAVKGESERRY